MGLSHFAAGDWLVARGVLRRNRRKNQFRNCDDGNSGRAKKHSCCERKPNGSRRHACRTARLRPLDGTQHTLDSGVVTREHGRFAIEVAARFEQPSRLSRRTQHFAQAPFVARAELAATSRNQQVIVGTIVGAHDDSPTISSKRG
jgi:hypothetical protein